MTMAGLRRSLGQAGLLALIAIIGAARPSAAIEYQLSSGLQLTGVNLEMKADGDVQLCFITVSVKNSTGKDQVFEIAVDSDDGYSVITYSGGPDRKATKAGAIETSEFKTILRRLPKDLAISIKPAE
jgi:hypothetical protein